MSEEVGETRGTAVRGEKEGGRGRLLRARPTVLGLSIMGFPEQELLLLLSRTETGLDVLKLDSLW